MILSLVAAAAFRPSDAPPEPIADVEEAAAPVPLQAEPAADPARESLVPDAAESLGTGAASFYGRSLAGHPTASGEPFDPALLTAAHRNLPFGSRVRVTNERSGLSVVVRVNDRGPFHDGRVIDVSRAAADALGMVESGTAPVKLELLSP